MRFSQGTSDNIVSKVERGQEVIGGLCHHWQFQRCQVSWQHMQRSPGLEPPVFAVFVVFVVSAVFANTATTTNPANRTNTANTATTTKPANMANNNYCIIHLRPIRLSLRKPTPGLERLWGICSCIEFHDALCRCKLGSRSRKQLQQTLILDSLDLHLFHTSENCFSPTFEV